MGKHFADPVRRALVAAAKVAPVAAALDASGCFDKIACAAECSEQIETFPTQPPVRLITPPTLITPYMGTGCPIDNGTLTFVPGDFAFTPDGGLGPFVPFDSGMGPLRWTPGDTPSLEWCHVLCGLGSCKDCLPEDRAGSILLGCSIPSDASWFPPTCAPSIVDCTRRSLCELPEAGTDASANDASKDGK